MSDLATLKQKSLPLVLDGETYYLRYDLYALSLVEERYGDIDKGFEALMGKSKSKPLIKTIIFFLWAGLVACHPEITEKDAGQLATLIDLASMQDQLVKAAIDSMPKEEGGQGNVSEAPPTGPTSGSSGGEQQEAPTTPGSGAAPSAK